MEILLFNYRLESFFFNYHLGNHFNRFKNTISERPFWKHEKVLSPGGIQRKQALWGPIVINLCFISSRKRFWELRCKIVFLKLKNVSSPGESLRKQLIRGPIVFNLCFIGVGNGWGFPKQNFTAAFWKLENVFLPPKESPKAALEGSNCF